MHNTKIVSSKANEEKVLEKKRYDNHTRELAIGLKEMYRVMLKYPEVCTLWYLKNSYYAIGFTCWHQDNYLQKLLMLLLYINLKMVLTLDHLVTASGKKKSLALTAN